MALSVLALALLLVLVGWPTPLPQGRTPWREQAVSLVGIVGAPILGGLVASRRPRNPYGWLWLGFGAGLVLQLFGESYAAYALVAEPGSIPAPRSISRLLGAGGPLALICAPFLLLLFPTGSLPSRRWRPLAWVAVIPGVMLLALNLVFGHPDKVGGAITAVTVAVVGVIFATIALSALSILVRFHRASGAERQQLKWFALAAILAAAYVVGSLLGFERLLGKAWWNLLDAAVNTGLYAAVGIAVLRYRLFDIDVIINRALVYAALTASLAVVYFGGVTVIQAVLQTLGGQGELPQLAVVGSTLATAALFNPLRRRIQTFIDQRFYRRKYDARKTLDAYSAKLRDTTDLGLLNSELVSVVAETVQPAHASLWLRPAAEVGRGGGASR
ncbi:MAG TPA: hypothetical protein VKA73_04235 [Rubrobacter sp.]|nr:hypothetical protein [Rubrobacter sp.]